MLNLNKPVHICYPDLILLSISSQERGAVAIVLPYFSLFLDKYQVINCLNRGPIYLLPHSYLLVL